MVEGGIIAMQIRFEKKSPREFFGKMSSAPTDFKTSPSSIISPQLKKWQGFSRRAIEKMADPRSARNLHRGAQEPGSSCEAFKASMAQKTYGSKLASTGGFHFFLKHGQIVKVASLGTVFSALVANQGIPNESPHRPHQIGNNR